jgi:hypothetical protein
MPPLSVWPGLLPLARHYSSQKCNNINSSSLNVTSLGKDCCLIVDSFEKNYREKKTDKGFSAAIRLRSAAAQISLALMKPSSLNVDRCSSTVMK